jgi:PST family polysaccharide transporter
MFPAIVNARKIDFTQYAKRLKALSALTIGVTATIALPLFIFAPQIISIIFGDSFILATPVLRIYLWTSIAITLVVLAQHYLIAENLSRIFLYSSIIGATSNIILNIILIPIYGPEGSAWGTTISYLVVVISLLLFKKSRDGIISILK